MTFFLFKNFVQIDHSIYDIFLQHQRNDNIIFRRKRLFQNSNDSFMVFLHIQVYKPNIIDNFSWNIFMIKDKDLYNNMIQQFSFAFVRIKSM
jgi:hypothetical protein